jgi:hypothetical protein
LGKFLSCFLYRVPLKKKGPHGHSTIDKYCLAGIVIQVEVNVNVICQRCTYFTKF